MVINMTHLSIVCLFHACTAVLDTPCTGVGQQVVEVHPDRADVGGRRGVCCFIMQLRLACTAAQIRNRLYSSVLVASAAACFGT